MLKLSLIAAFVTVSISLSACANNQHTKGIQTLKSKTILAPFDIVHTKITTQDNIATFHMAVSGKAGANKLTPTGQLAGSNVFSYV